jgi:autotransporter-associated beta strand protein
MGGAGSSGATFITGQANTNAFTINAPDSGTNIIGANGAGSAFVMTGPVTLNGDLMIQSFFSSSLQSSRARPTLNGGITGTGNLILNNLSGGTNTITLGVNPINHTGSITAQGGSPGSNIISAVIGANVTGVTQNSATSPLILSAANTYAGNTTISTGTLTLVDNGQLKFTIGNNGVNNQLNGSGTANLDGDFNLDLSGAAATPGNSWTLVDVGALTETFGSTFSVTSTLGAFTENANVWTLQPGLHSLWTFTESTGVLGFSQPNNAPVAVNTTNSVAQGGSVTIPLDLGKYKLATDADNDSLTIISVSASLGNVGTDGSSINYTNTSGSVGASDSISFTVVDNYGGTNSADVVILITSATGANLISATAGDGNAYLSYLGIPGYNYALDKANSITPPITWVPQVTNTADGFGRLNYTNLLSTWPTNDFFRTRYVP